MVQRGFPNGKAMLKVFVAKRLLRQAWVIKLQSYILDASSNQPEHNGLTTYNLS